MSRARERTGSKSEGKRKQKNRIIRQMPRCFALQHGAHSAERVRPPRQNADKRRAIPLREQTPASDSSSMLLSSSEKRFSGLSGSIRRFFPLSRPPEKRHPLPLRFLLLATHAHNACACRGGIGISGLSTFVPSLPKQRGTQRI